MHLKLRENAKGLSIRHRSEISRTYKTTKSEPREKLQNIYHWSKQSM